MLRPAAVIAAALMSPSAPSKAVSPQDAPKAPPVVSAWTDFGAARPRVIRAGISVAREEGSVKLTGVSDYGKEGLDNVAQYRSADERISGTIFLYYPTLSDTGLTFLATD